LVPFIYFLLSMLVVIVWFVGYLSVMSINPISASKYVWQVRTVNWTQETYVYAFIMWFGLLWTLIIIDYIKNFIVLVSVSTYYWNSPKCEVDEKGEYILDHEGDPKLVEPEEDGEAEVMLAARYAHVKHLGSICFAALIITIIKVIRFLFVYLAKKALAATGQEDTAWGKVVKVLIACGDCILRCLEKICDYINKAALAYMAINGENFCKSALDGFILNLKHAATFASSHFFASTLIFLGKAAITVLNVFTCWFLVPAILGEGAARDGPCIVVGILTWFTTEVWLTIFDQSVLGMMTSLAVDTDVNGGKAKRGPKTFDHERNVYDAPDPTVNGTKPNAVVEGGEQEL